jgi:hypothetical protein
MNEGANVNFASLFNQPKYLHNQKQKQALTAKTYLKIRYQHFQ